MDNYILTTIYLVILAEYSHRKKYFEKYLFDNVCWIVDIYFEKYLVGWRVDSGEWIVDIYLGEKMKRIIFKLCSLINILGGRKIAFICAEIEILYRHPDDPDQISQKLCFSRTQYIQYANLLNVI